MNNFKRFAIGLSAAVCVTAACAQSVPSTKGHFDKRLTAPQFRMGQGNAKNGMRLQRPTAQRRFIMPTNSYYSRSITPYRAGANNMGSRNVRMTADERRALRRQINEANQGIYMRRRTSAPGF